MGIWSGWHLQISFSDLGFANRVRVSLRLSLPCARCLMCSPSRTGSTATMVVALPDDTARRSTTADAQRAMSQSRIPLLASTFARTTPIQGTVRRRRASVALSAEPASSADDTANELAPDSAVAITTMTAGSQGLASRPASRAHTGARGSANDAKSAGTHWHARHSHAHNPEPAGDSSSQGHGHLGGIQTACRGAHTTLQRRALRARLFAVIMCNLIVCAAFGVPPALIHAASTEIAAVGRLQVLAASLPTGKRVLEHSQSASHVGFANHSPSSSAPLAPVTSQLLSEQRVNTIMHTQIAARQMAYATAIGNATLFKVTQRRLVALTDELEERHRALLFGSADDPYCVMTAGNTKLFEGRRSSLPSHQAAKHPWAKQRPRIFCIHLRIVSVVERYSLAVRCNGMNNPRS